MTEQILGALRQITSPIRPWYVLASVVALAAMVIAIEFGSNWVLNFVHVMCGGLWTGIDLFMGFVIGPILRRLPLEARRAVISALVPRTLFLMPTLSIITATSGWFLAERTGFLDLNYPEFWWVVASLVIVAVLTVQGLGISCRQTCASISSFRSRRRILRWLRVGCGSTSASSPLKERCRSLSSSSWRALRPGHDRHSASCA